jgi:hypothetical protein
MKRSLVGEFILATDIKGDLSENRSRAWLLCAIVVGKVVLRELCSAWTWELDGCLYTVEVGRSGVKLEYW